MAAWRRCDAFAQHVREDGYWRLAQPRAGHLQYRSCGRPGRVRESSHDASASADAVGSPFGSPVADRLCGTYLDQSPAWWVRTCPVHPQGDVSGWV